MQNLNSNKATSTQNVLVAVLIGVCGTVLYLPVLSLMNFYITITMSGPANETTSFEIKMFFIIEIFIVLSCIPFGFFCYGLKRKSSDRSKS
jgi:hypothetical protein